jgi:hypothetical protein
MGQLVADTSVKREIGRGFGHRGGLPRFRSVIGKSARLAGQTEADTVRASGMTDKKVDNPQIDLPFGVLAC